jgi:hypothetical protein
MKVSTLGNNIFRVINSNSFDFRSEIVLIDNFTKLVNGEVDLLICQPHFENLPLKVIESYPTIKTKYSFTTILTLLSNDTFSA